MRRTMILVLLAAVMLTVSILTWGSVGSVVLLFCMVMMGASVMYQRFVTNRDDDFFKTED